MIEEKTRRIYEIAKPCLPDGWIRAVVGICKSNYGIRIEVYASLDGESYEECGTPEVYLGIIHEVENEPWQEWNIEVSREENIVSVVKL